MRYQVPVAKCDSCHEVIDLLTKLTAVEFQGADGRRLHFEGDLCVPCAERLDSILEDVGKILPGFKPKKAVKVAPVAQSDAEFIAPPPQVGKSKNGKTLSRANTRGGYPIEYTTCQICAWTCPTRSALGLHAKQKHGTTLSDPNVALPLLKEF